MYSKYQNQQPQQRFTKIMRKLNSSNQKISTTQPLYHQNLAYSKQENGSGLGSTYSNKKSEQTSVIARNSIHTSQNSTKNTSDIRNINLTPLKTRPLSPVVYYQSKERKKLTNADTIFQEAVSTLLQSHQVLINRVRNTIRSQFIPTSNGLRCIMVLEQGQYLNLSWVHSVQQLQKTKILLLYYDLQKIKSNQKPQIISLVVQFARQKDAVAFLKAVQIWHSKFHDENVQKLYHQIVS